MPLSNTYAYRSDTEVRFKLRGVSGDLLTDTAEVTAVINGKKATVTYLGANVFLAIVPQRAATSAGRSATLELRITQADGLQWSAHITRPVKVVEG